MSLATLEDVAARLGRPLLQDESTRVTAFLQDVTGLIEDYCGRDMDRRQDQLLTLYSEGGSSLPVPARFRTFLTAASVHQDGQEVTGWAYDGRSLVRAAGWPSGPLEMRGSWGYATTPASIKAVACSEVIRWLAVAPGIESERVGEVEVSFTGASSTQSLSSVSRTSLRPYRRRGVGTITLLKEGP